jgi:hypothetical protein
MKRYVFESTSNFPSARTSKNACFKYERGQIEIDEHSVQANVRRRIKNNDIVCRNILMQCIGLQEKATMCLDRIQENKGKLVRKCRSFEPLTSRRRHGATMYSVPIKW